MKEVIDFANNGGYVFGVCNGFQILCEAGLLPGALLHNPDHQFLCSNVFIRAEHQNSLLTSVIDPNKILKIPIAHGQGNYYVDPVALKSMSDNGQILFRYCDESGNVNQDANPNGSLNNIAGISNAGKNVFGMMPHPERAADGELGNTDGRIIFESLLVKVQI